VQPCYDSGGKKENNVVIRCCLNLLQIFVVHGSMPFGFAMKIIVGVLFFTVLFFCCKKKHVDSEFIKNKMWVYDRGTRLGDIDAINLAAPKYFKLRHDTIFRQDIPFAVVVEINRKERAIKLQSVQDHSTGRYLDINVFNGK